MSVDYSAVVACGWVVSDAEVHCCSRYLFQGYS